MALSPQTLRDLQGFLLSDCVTIKGSQIQIVNTLLAALQTEQLLQASQQAQTTRLSTLPPKSPDDA